jgi:hypothetical protein
MVLEVFETLPEHIATEGVGSRSIQNILECPKNSERSNPWEHHGSWAARAPPRRWTREEWVHVVDSYPKSVWGEESTRTPTPSALVGLAEVQGGLSSPLYKGGGEGDQGQPFNLWILEIEYGKSATTHRSLLLVANMAESS